MPYPPPPPCLAGTPSSRLGRLQGEERGEEEGGRREERGTGTEGGRSVPRTSDLRPTSPLLRPPSSSSVLRPPSSRPGHLSASGGHLSPGQVRARLRIRARFHRFRAGTALALTPGVISGTSSMDRAVARGGLSRRAWLGLAALRAADRRRRVRVARLPAAGLGGPRDGRVAHADRSGHARQSRARCLRGRAHRVGQRADAVCRHRPAS